MRQFSLMLMLLLTSLLFQSAPAFSAPPNVSWWQGESNANDSVTGNNGSTVNRNTTVPENADVLLSCGSDGPITSFSAIYGSHCGIPVDCSQGVANNTCKVGIDSACELQFYTDSCNNGDPCLNIVKTGTLDLSCSTNDTTMFAAGKVGQAFSFDGNTTHYISIPNNGSLDLATGHAVTSWVKLNALPATGKSFMLINKWTNGKEDKGVIVDSDGSVTYELFGTSVITIKSTAKLSVNRWYHIAAMYDGTAMKLYIDGALDTSKPATGAVSNGTGGLFFGYNPDRDFQGSELPFNGQLDEVGWYNRALTPEEISALSGTCGTSNGALFTAAPTTNLCAVGVASAVAGTGPWTWTCSTEATTNCSAYLQGTLVLPKTGQTTSYAAGDDGAIQAGAARNDPVFIDNGDGTITDKVYNMTWQKDAGTNVTSIPMGIVGVPATRFTDNHNGTQTDNLTGLVWLKNPGCFSSAQTWAAALNSANTLKGDNTQCALNDGSVAGDWRLPNTDELASAATNWNGASPAEWLNAAGQGFVNIWTNGYWSSTTYAGYTTFAWSVYMQGGYVGNVNKTASYYVWPVRGGQSGSFGTLNISKNGTGIVSSNPARIDCGATCTANFAAGQSVVLTATPDSGSFASWTGCDSSTVNQCTVTATGAKSVTVTFALTPTYAVTYAANGSTSGTTPATQIKTQGIALALATNSGSLAKTGYSFVGWNTSADGTGATYAVGAPYSTDTPVELFAKWSLNGACGTSNGAFFTVAPTTNLCAAGTASVVAGTGPWTWSCGTVTIASCSTYLQGTVVLPKTGQTKCYDPTGSTTSEIPCSGTGQDGEKQVGAAQTDPVLFIDNGITITDKVYDMTWLKDAWVNGADMKNGIVGVPDPRFTDNHNGTQTDKLTGLIWLKDLGCFSILQNWATALNSANTLKGDNTQCDLTDGSVAGDWRLPNINELVSVATNWNGESPAAWLNAAGQVFMNVQADAYWSSSTSAASAGNVWLVSMRDGWVGYGSKGYNSYVWPVRDGQTGSLGTLAISKTGTGAGSVSSNPERLSCGATCTANFAAGQVVILTATEDRGSAFTGWSGCDSSTGNQCTVKVTGTKNVTATLATVPATTLTVNLPGSGSGSVTSTLGITPQLSCAPPQTSCSASVAFGFDVTLSATPSLGSAPVAWSGACSSEPCSFQMDGPKTANATFDLYRYLKNGVVYYGTVKDALAAAKSGETVKAKTMQMLDSGVTFDTGLPVFFHGGYANIDDAAPSGYSTLVGPLVIKSGILTVDRVTVK